MSFLSNTHNTSVFLLWLIFVSLIHNIDISSIFGGGKKYKKSNEIAVAYFGDGAIEEGVVHECLNIAALMHLPILFICENLQFYSYKF